MVTLKKEVSEAIPIERIVGCIYFLRKKKIIIDSDLAKLYGVETKDLNRAVRRNINRFPPDFMFQLNQKEIEIVDRNLFQGKEDENSLRCQIGTSKTTEGRGGRRYLPLAFTEQGVAMLSSILNSPRAIYTNIQIIRTFTKLRELMRTNEDLKKKIEEIERKSDQHFKIIFDFIKKFLDKDESNHKSIIGFKI